MAVGSILLGLALLVIVALFLAKPLLSASPQAAAAVDSDRRRELEEQKEAYLNEIRALDFDYETGKIPAEVYDLQRAQLVNEAAVILKELEDFPVVEDDVYSQIEAAVAARRHHQVLSGNGKHGFCPHCGQPIDLGDKFCANCGQPIKLASPTT